MSRERGVAVEARAGDLVSMNRETVGPYAMGENSCIDRGENFWR